MWTRRLLGYLAGKPRQRERLRSGTVEHPAIARFLAGIAHHSSNPVGEVAKGAVVNRQIDREVEYACAVTEAVGLAPHDRLRPLTDSIMARLAGEHDLAMSERLKLLDLIGRGLARALVRRAHRELEPASETARLAADETARNDAPQAVLHRDDGWRALQLINAEQARIFNLATFCRRTVEEIGELLGLAPQEVKAALRHAELEVAQGGDLEGSGN